MYQVQKDLGHITGHFVDNFVSQMTQPTAS